MMLWHGGVLFMARVSRGTRVYHEGGWVGFGDWRGVKALRATIELGCGVWEDGTSSPGLARAYAPRQPAKSCSS